MLKWHLTGVTVLLFWNTTHQSHKQTNLRKQNKLRTIVWWSINISSMFFAVTALDQIFKHIFKKFFAVSYTRPQMDVTATTHRIIII